MKIWVLSLLDANLFSQQFYAEDSAPSLEEIKEWLTECKVYGGYIPLILEKLSNGKGFNDSWGLAVSFKLVDVIQKKGQ